MIIFSYIIITIFITIIIITIIIITTIIIMIIDWLRSNKREQERQRRCNSSSQSGCYTVKVMVMVVMVMVMVMVHRYDIKFEDKPLVSLHNVTFANPVSLDVYNRSLWLVIQPDIRCNCTCQIFSFCHSPTSQWQLCLSDSEDRWLQVQRRSGYHQVTPPNIMFIYLPSNHLNICSSRDGLNPGSINKIRVENEHVS